MLLELLCTIIAVELVVIIGIAYFAAERIIGVYDMRSTLVEDDGVPELTEEMRMKLYS